MNQIIRNLIYMKGTTEQCEFMAKKGGMNEEEKRLFFLIHDGRNELYIQEEMGLSRKSYERIEESVRQKLLIAVFECINIHMEHSRF